MAIAPGRTCGLVLMKAYRSMARHAQRSIAAHDIGLSDFAILEALLHKGPMLVNEIGRRIQLTSGSISTPSTGSKRAPRRALCRRGDRRVKKVDLTRSGRALITRNLRQAPQGRPRRRRRRLDARRAGDANCAAQEARHDG